MSDSLILEDSLRGLGLKNSIAALANALRDVSGHMVVPARSVWGGSSMIARPSGTTFASNPSNSDREKRPSYEMAAIKHGSLGQSPLAQDDSVGKKVRPDEEGIEVVEVVLKSSHARPCLMST